MREGGCSGKGALPSRSDFRSATHRNAFVFASSRFFTSIDADAIPPAASRADAKNNTLTVTMDDMKECAHGWPFSGNYSLEGASRGLLLVKESVETDELVTNAPTFCSTR
ncbi:hypothetical protein ACHAW5_001742 [Stephanodiscus triporus]|uniref:Uncharacterized protein n=1 Tax=Stephanodiscus triporus TaxID=2934178 RepID=A0ABD3QUB6_9STRA